MNVADKLHRLIDFFFGDKGVGKTPFASLGHAPGPVNHEPRQAQKTDNSAEIQAVRERLNGENLTFEMLHDLLGEGVVQGESELQDLIANKLESFAGNFNGWKDFLEQADSDSSLERLAAGKLVNSEEATPAMLYDLLAYDAISEDCKLKEQVFARLRSATATFDEWKEIHSDDDEDDLQEIVLGKLIDTARTVDELLETGQSVSDDDDDLKEKLKARARVIITTRDDCQKVIDDTDDTILFDEVVNILLDLCTTAAECLELYHSATDDWTTDDQFQRNVLDKLFSLATESECKIIALLAEDDSELKSEAERHAEKK